MSSATGERLVVNFHGIGEPPDSVPADERPYWCPRPAWPAFADALAEVAGRADVTLQITFDDGNLSDLTDGLPALAQRGLRATFHICAGRFGLPGYLAEDHLAEFRAAGMGIGSHGWDHVDLRPLDGAALRREAVESKARIAAAAGVPVTEFAIPFGSYDRRVLAALRGYRTVYTSDRRRAGGSGRVVPRMSYMTGWQPADLLRFATERYSVADRLRHYAAGLAKRLR